jgi:hypothetical protein
MALSALQNPQPMDALAMGNSPKQPSCVNYNEDETGNKLVVVIINGASLYQT